MLPWQLCDFLNKINSLLMSLYPLNGQLRNVDIVVLIDYRRRGIIIFSVN